MRPLKRAKTKGGICRATQKLCTFPVVPHGERGPARSGKAVQVDGIHWETPDNIKVFIFVRERVSIRFRKSGIVAMDGEKALIEADRIFDLDGQAGLIEFPVPALQEFLPIFGLTQGIA